MDLFEEYATQNQIEAPMDLYSAPPDAQEDKKNPDDERVPFETEEFQNVLAHENVHQEKNPLLEKLMIDLSQQLTTDTKLQQVLQFMEACLSSTHGPNFRAFWDVKKVCLDLFKEESLAPALRQQYWNRILELSQEVRRLKEVMDEQSAFASEQIDIAIQGLEKELEAFPELLTKVSSFKWDVDIKTFNDDQWNFYQTRQRELDFLNAYASRINGLRKELIKTEMRIRHKNKFFQRLSSAGDRVFPRRKDLIKDVSSRFMEDVESFIRQHFQGEEIPQSFFFLREEIKALQRAAKTLTLNTQSFTQTRVCLSECWDKIKKYEKERKKERAEQKASFRDHAEKVLEKIQQFQQQFQAGEISTANASQKLDEISAFMRSQQLGKEELKALREEFNAVRKLLQEKLKEEEEQRQQEEHERDRQRREKFFLLKQKMEEVLKTASQLDPDRILSLKEEALDEIAKSGLSKSEKQEVEKLLKPLRDMIDEKKKQKLLSLSPDDQNAIDKLHDLLQEYKGRRQEIKDQLEQLRKASGSSKLDFEHAMKVQEQLHVEKEQLEKINETIEELEEKIQEYS